MKYVVHGVELDMPRYGLPDEPYCRPEVEGGWTEEFDSLAEAIALVKKVRDGSICEDAAIYVMDSDKPIVGFEYSYLF